MNWKPIETAPKDGTEILIATKYSAGWAINDAYWISSRRCWIDGFCENCECPNGYERPTLWTELPNPDRPDDGDSRLLSGALLLLKEAGVMPSSTELIEAAERAGKVASHKSL